MHTLVQAFLAKSTYRKPISDETRKRLLEAQHYSCAICGQSIDMHAHADHIVPFAYVGDELPDNLQMLCAHCNEAKRESIDYQIRYLLNTL